MRFEASFEVADSPNFEMSDLQFEVCETLGGIEKSEWDACFPGELERYDYLLAVEKSSLRGFQWRYATIRSYGRLIAAAPVFLCDYGLETTLERGRLSRLIEKLRSIVPGFLSLKLACLGSPCTECGRIGTHPGIPDLWKADLLAVMLRQTSAWAERAGYGLFGLKDIPLPLDWTLSKAIDEAGLVRMASLPTASLSIDFSSIDTYLSRLSPGTRKDMRRKLRARSQVTVETVEDLGDLLPRFIELYRQTRLRSEWQFEDLTEDYFAGVLANMGSNAFCKVYRVGDEVLAFNLLLRDEARLVDKFFCMDAERGRSYNLYYMSWFENIRFCLENRLALYQSGQAYYENKIRLGSQLTENALFFRHKNPVLQSVLGLLAPLFGTDGTGKARQ
ncbi:GNAT family N-acetyltransferase [Rhizobium helianthi]|uniref:GNAT family N-acetyltransferase n=1 Tax=Rhizobium helianthi TaxID=1132695 RepID=A0ABW4M7Y0_9HYPH